MASSWEKSLKRRFKVRKIAQPKKPADSHRGNPEADPVPGIDLPLCHEPRKLSMSLEELLNTELPQVNSILPGLLATGQTTLVRVAPGVDYKWYVNAIAVLVTAGARIPPYGPATPCQTTLAYIGSISQRTHEQLDLLRSSLGSWLPLSRANHNLDVISFRDIQKRQLMDHDYWHKENSEALISPEKNLLIVADAHLAVGKHKDTWKELDGDLAFRRLSDPSVATLVCLQADKRAWETIQDSIWARRSYRSVEFLPWPAAPKQYGAGFTVSLDKTSEYDPTPVMFDVFYCVNKDRIEIGWQIHDATDVVSPKQTAIAERRWKIADLLERKTPQKEIATILKIDESTVSRDVQAIKSRKATARRNAANYEEIDETA